MKDQETLTTSQCHMVLRVTTNNDTPKPHVERSSAVHSSGDRQNREIPSPSQLSCSSLFSILDQVSRTREIDLRYL
ncbi:MAG TPA: hypothetical protein VN372_07665 [Methanospirillum sp.]|nr:hypothetical protein [Methanospirillum sp.]